MPRSPLLRRPLIALGAAALLLVGPAPQAFADYGGALVVGDLPLGDHREDFRVEGFTVRATDSAHVTVSGHNRASDTGQEYSQRLQLNGAGGADHRSVQFRADAGDQVTVYAQSGGSATDRALALYDESWIEVDRVPAYRGDSGSILPAQTLDIHAEGTYWIASPSAGVNIYHLELGEAADGPGRVEWKDVSEPVIEATTVGEEEPGVIQVRYRGAVGPDGGDLVRALLLDEDGEVVDEQISVATADGGTFALTPQASGSYRVQVQLERHAEDAPLVAASTVHEDFVLPLAAPGITSVLTAEVQGERADITAQWSAVPEAETYTVAVREAGEREFAEAAGPTEDTSALVRDLSVGTSYELQVTAERGGQSSSSEAYGFTVADEVQRWDTARAGVGSGGTVTEHEDGAIAFDLRGNNSKIADSEDGFWYHYTEIDPSTENFTLSATFTVDDSAGKDNQSGFGIIAVDDFVPGDSSARYFNSAGAMAAKYTRGAGGEEGTRFGTPGAKFVHGYTEGPSTASAARNLSDSRAFDWDYKSGHTEGSNVNPPRFEAGETYEFTLRRSNTGFHSIWQREDGEIAEVIQYDPDMLLTQDSERFFLGVFAARDIAVTVSDLDLTTIAPGDDAPAEEPPAQYVTPRLDVDITSTTPHREIEVPLVANLHGEARILDDGGEPVTDPVRLAPGARGLIGLEGLQKGENSYTAVFTPDAHQPHFTDRQELESTDPVELPLSFAVHSYGSPGESIWVSPDGAAQNSGTRENPLDVHTAVDYAQPGQQIILTEGTYRPERAIVMERGRNGTEDDPITMLSEPGTRATFDLSESAGGGFILRADHWHLYNMEVTNSRAFQKPMLIQGHHNVVEKIESHHNQGTGVQISGLDSEPVDMWPSFNTVLSSVAHNNADPLANDADGFAAKLTAGEGNRFRWTISYHNIDDGYDLYAKSTTGPTGAVLIEDSVAFNNGRLEDDPEATRTADGQGFKLGGESMPGKHMLRNSISYGNLGNGVTSNSGPDVRLQDVTSVFNGTVRSDRQGGNLSLRTNATRTDYEMRGFLSWAGGAGDSVSLRGQDDDLLKDPSNWLNGRSVTDASERVTEEWFVSVDRAGNRPSIAEDGSIEMNGLFELTSAAPTDTGARLKSNPEPTVIELRPEISSNSDEGDDDSGTSGPPRGAGNNNGQGNGHGPEGNSGNGAGKALERQPGKGNGPNRPDHPVFSP